MPSIKSANRIAGSPLGDNHTVVLFDSIESEGSIEYAFIVAVFRNDDEQPCLFVAAEANAMAATLGGGSHFLGVFDGNGHANLGDSDDWADPKKFFPHAIDIAAERMGVDSAN